MEKFYLITTNFLKLSEIKKFRNFIFFFSCFLLIGNSSKSQVTIITNTVTWTTGWCNICGPTVGNYACAAGSGSPMWNAGIRTFTAPAIPGQVVTGVCVTVNKVDCGLTNLCVTLNGINIQCIPTPPGTNCNCGACWPQTFCNNFPCPTGIPGFVYGGLNQIQLINTGNLCVNNAVITLTYQTCCLAPTITAVANPTSVCAGFPSTLSASGAGIGGTYTWQPGALVGSVVVVSPTVTTIYTVSGTSTLACTGTRTVQVTVNPAPTITATPNPTAICIGNTSTVTLTGASTYTTNVGGMIGTPIVLAPTVTTIYTVTGTSSLGCIGTRTFQIIVNPLPIVIPGSNSPICAGGNLSLTVGAGATYSWTGPLAYTSNVQNPVRPNVTIAMAGVYTVSVTNVSGCTASGTVNVVINPPPVISPTNGGPYCAGATINLSVTAFTSYTWTGPNAFGSNAQNPSIVNGQIINGGVYTVTVTGVGGCMSTGTTNVVVNPVPTPTATANSPVCVGQQINLTGAGGTTYTWSGPGGFSSLNQNTLIAIAQVSNAGVYTLTAGNAFGCTRTATVNVVVNPLPVIVVNSPTVCVGQNINLTATGGTAYAWSGPLGFVSAVQNPVIPGAIIAMSGGYTVLVTTAFGCTNTAVANVSVITLPVPNIISNSPVCVGGTLSFTATGAGAYSWTGPNGFTSLIANPSIINVTLPAGGIYTLVGTAGTCSNVTTASITINPLPTPTATANSPVCVGQPINFTGMGGVTYTWSGPGGFASNAVNPSIAIAQVTNAGVYTLNVSNAFGCTRNTTVNVVINTLPVIVVNNPTVCLNTSINLTATGGTAYAWSGPLGYVSAVQNPVIPNALIPMSGAYTVTVTSGFGCTNTAVANVLVLNLPAPVITSNTPCVGAVLTLTATGAGAYSWTGPNGFTSLIANPTIPNVTLLAGGIYTLVGTAGTCSNVTTALITINPLPVPTATSNSAVCLNQQLNLMGGGGTAYAWAGPGGYTNPTQNPVIAVASMSNAGTYTLTVTNANNCTNTITTSVVINPLPTPSAIGSTVCLNTTINLTSLGANTYAWSGPNAFASALQNPSIPNAQLIMGGTYTVIGTSALGCTNSAMANVVVIPLPSPTITSNSAICIGSTLNFNGMGGASYSWSGPNGFASVLQNPTIANAGMAANGTYSLIATVGTCTNVTTALIVVNPLPTPTVTSNSPVCLLKPINFFASGGTTFVWSGPNGFTGNGSNITIGSASNIHIGTYLITVTDGNNCTNTITTTVIVNPLPIISAVGSTLCAEKTISLSANGGTSFAWVGPNGYASSSGTNSIPNSMLNMQGNYSVTVTDMNGCVSTSVTNVKINPLPTPTANANTPICSNQTINLSAGDATAISYIWTGPNGFISTLQNPVLTNATPSCSGLYTVTVADNIGCSAKVIVGMVVNELPLVNIVPDKNHGCVPVCITFSPLSTSSIQSSFWDFGDGSTAGGNVVTKCFTRSGNYDIKSKFVDMNGCSNTATFTVGTDPIPVADFNYASGKPIINEVVEFTDASHGANIMNWSWNFSHLKNKVVLKQNTSLVYEEAGTYVVALIVISDMGCRDTAVKSIVIGEDFGLFVPDAFSPNGDGLNDLFQPKGYGIVKYELNVFDRWGERMFSTQDFNTGWDGTFVRRGGEPVKEDVYVWSVKVISVFGKSKEFHGTVTLLK